MTTTALADLRCHRRGHLLARISSDGTGSLWVESTAFEQHEWDGIDLWTGERIADRKSPMSAQPPRQLGGPTVPGAASREGQRYGCKCGLSRWLSDGIIRDAIGRGERKILVNVR